VLNEGTKGRRNGNKAGRRVLKAFKVVGLFYVVVLVVVPFVFAGMTGRSCNDWERREVPSFKANLTEIAREAVNTRTIEVPILPSGWDGMAVAGTTFVLAGGDSTVVLHEAVHHMQIEREGLVKYALKYAYQWTAGVYNGCGYYDAYRSVEYEVQARRSVAILPYPVLNALEETENIEEFTDKLRVLEARGELYMVQNDDDGAWRAGWVVAPQPPNGPR
jgi:hypothetical protein